jgi:hypothetical protein
MEEEEVKKTEDETPSEPPEQKDDIKVKVITPFKPGVRVSRIIRQGKCYYHPAKPASYVCASCQKSVCNVCGTDVGGVYFCPQCIPPVPPMTQPVAQGKTKTDTSLYKAMFSIGLILILIGAILFVTYWPISSMSAAEFENLQVAYWDGGGHNYEDYRPRDIITIKDKIVRMEDDFDTQWGVITMLWFESTGKDDNDFVLTFDADLERDYRVGDWVSISFHVEEDERTHDEVIRELNNNLPDTSNIDQVFSVDLVFISLIIIGIFLVVIYIVFMRKLREPKPQSLDSNGDLNEYSKDKGESNL